MTPAGYVDGLNLYLYVGGNPILLIDPFGLDAISEQYERQRRNDELMRRGLSTVPGQPQYNNGAYRPAVGSEDANSQCEEPVTSEQIDELARQGAAGDIAAHEDRVDDAYAKGFAEGAIGGAAGLAAAGADAATFGLAGDVVEDAAIALGADADSVAMGRTVGEVGFTTIEVVATGGAVTLVKEAGEQGLKQGLKQVDSVVPNGLCFVAGTTVSTDQGLVPIEELRVGMRVNTTERAGLDPRSGADASLDPAIQVEVDPNSWRLIHLEMPNPDGSNDTLQLTCLRSLQWIREIRAIPGASIHFVLEEMGLAGTAIVTGVETCPAIDDGLGQVVKSTVTHLNGYVLRLWIEGMDDPLEPTSSHRLYSEDRTAWVAAGDLRVGERVHCLDGARRIQAIDAKPGIHRVYNIEVDADHCYYVGALGVLSHNINPCAMPTAPRGMNNPATREALETGNRVHDRVTTGARAKGWEADQVLPGSRMRPDVVTPRGRPVEIKPGTPTGVRAGQLQLQRYRGITGTNGRVLYYDPRNPFGRLSFTPHLR